MQVKICGLRQPEDALAAAAAGADWLGMVFVPERHRRITPAQALEIVEAVRQPSRLDATDASSPRPAPRPTPRMVGLFADQPAAEVNAVIGQCALDAVQLCGQETPEYAAAMDCAVLKVIHIPAEAGPEAVDAVEGRLRPYRAAGCRLTLDRLVAGVQGGTGEGFDWRLAAGLAQRGHQFLLAGGLTPDNVAAAIAAAQPWGVDVSSGVETAGAKDHAKIRQFIQQAKAAPTVIPA